MKTQPPVFPPMRILATSLTPLLAAAGCTSVGTDYVAPVAAVPAEFRAGGDVAFTPDSTDVSEWWRQLDDPVLDRLVERAIRQGPNLREALARLREARALRGVAAAGRYPAFDLDASYQRRGESERMALGPLAPNSSLYTVGLDASWEIDFWGRIARAVEAAEADLAASLEDTRDVALTVTAETALNYVELRAYQRRVAIARRNVELQEQTLSLVEARFEAGLVGERDVAQAATNVEITRSRVPALETGWRAAEHRLAVLIGRAPGELAAEIEAVRPIPVPPPEVAVGVPADLLRKRPDVRRAERILAAEHARIGVAAGNLYPRLALFGNLGLAADDASDLLRGGSDVFGIGPSIRWSLFDGARLRRRVEAQDARAEQALVRWERTVLTALEETENAMTAYVHEHVRRRSIQKAAAQASRAVELARYEYQEGLSDFQAVLDSQRELAQLEDELAQAEAAITADLVTLYKSLGGG